MSIQSKAFAAKLRELEGAIEAQGNNSKFSDTWGAQALPLVKEDLSLMVSQVADTVEAMEWSDEYDDFFDDLGTKVQFAITTMVPNLWSAQPVSGTLVQLMANIDFQLSSISGFASIRKSMVVPAALKRAVEATAERLSRVVTTLGGVEDKAKVIIAAHDAADKFPATQADLVAALAEVRRVSEQMDQYRAQAANTSEAVEQLAKRLADALAEADATLDRTRAAYRAATSEGLAHAFSKKAMNLNYSMYGWASALALSLWAAFAIGNSRFPQITAALSGAPDWRVVTIHLVLGGLAIAPAVWVAWISTKQIGQRFRLAEDYSYKAALSAAYEGYRTEAVSLDPKFQSALFSAALGRLDEIPLRLVEKDVHGSPVHELVERGGIFATLKDWPSRAAEMLSGARAAPAVAQKHVIDEGKD